MRYVYLFELLRTIFLPNDEPSYGIVHALRQAIMEKVEVLVVVINDYGWLMMFLFEVAMLVGKEGELWWDAGDDCVGGVGGLKFGDVGGVAVAGDDGVGDVGAGPSLSSTQH